MVLVVLLCVTYMVARLSCRICLLSLQVDQSSEGRVVIYWVLCYKAEKDYLTSIVPLSFTIPGLTEAGPITAIS